MSKPQESVPKVLDFEDDDAAGIGGTSGADGTGNGAGGGVGAAAPSGPVDDGSYYASLGVGRDASADDLKRAYRSLAAACHPDKVRDPELRAAAAEAFAKVQTAFEVRTMIFFRKRGKRMRE